MGTLPSTSEPQRLARPDGLEVAFFEPPLTPELWEAYERVTRSYACTRAFIEYFEESAGASLALVRSKPAGEDQAGFVYRVTPAGAALVLGRFAAPTAEALRAFAEAVFARHPGVGRIDTNLIDALPAPRAIGRPVLAVHEATEMRVRLPASMVEYERVLSTGFLAQIRYHQRRLAREHPSMRIATHERGDVPRAWIAEVVRLNRERMASKATESVYTPRYEDGIFRVVRTHGSVTVLQEGARVCAGVIGVLRGPQAFGWVVGHDNAYGKYRPGRLCQLAAIRHWIDRGARTLHFLHGESQYKRELGAHSAPLAVYVILRSWAALRPSDPLRLGSSRLSWAVRRSIEAGDRIGQRFLAGRTPLTSFARVVIHRARRLGRL